MDERKEMSEADRLAAAQEMIQRMAREYGVQIVIVQQVRRVDDGSVIVVPQISLQVIDKA